MYDTLHTESRDNLPCLSSLALTLPGPSAGVSGSLDSYCSLKPLCSGMGEVVPARTSPTLLPHPLALCCRYPVSKCRNASIAMIGTLRVKTGRVISAEGIECMTDTLASLVLWHCNTNLCHTATLTVHSWCFCWSSSKGFVNDKITTTTWFTWVLIEDKHHCTVTCNTSLDSLVLLK